eukprot:5987640-Pleurochrysis_carterae.AAC.1
MHTPFREYPSDSAKNRYEVPYRVTSISRVTYRVTRHVFLSAQYPPLASGMRETNDVATANPADDPARPTQPTLANTPGLDGCNTPATAAAMHITATPRTTRVTRTAYGNGARP